MAKIVSDLHVSQFGIKPSKFHIINIEKTDMIQTHHLLIPNLALPKKTKFGEGFL